MRPRSFVPVVAAVAVAAVVFAAGEAAAQSCVDEVVDVRAGTSDSVDFTGLVPGSTRQWPVTVDNTDDDPVDMRVTVDGTGVLSAVLRVGLEVCDVAWQPATSASPAVCPTGSTVLLAPASLDDGVELDLATLDAGDTWFAMFRATLPSSVGNEYQGTSGSVRSVVLWNTACGPVSTTTSTTTVTTAVPVTTGVPTSAPSPGPADPGPSGPAAPGPAAPGPAAPGPGPALPTQPPAGGPSPSVPPRLPFTGTTASVMVGLGLALVAGGATSAAAGARRRRVDP